MRLLVLLLFAFPAWAQNYPTKPIRLVVPFAPGGSSTIVARSVAAEMEKALGQSIVIENKGGGGGNPAGQNTGQGFVNLKHWDERSGAENTADAIAERATGAFRNLRDAQVFVLVPGSVQGLGDTSGFNMQFQNASGMSREQFVAAKDQLLERAGQSPLLSQVRLSDLPDVATLSETFPGFEQVSWFGLLVPAGTPKDVSTKIHGAMARTLAVPEVRQKLVDGGFEMVASSPEEFLRFVRAESDKLGKLIRDNGIKVE